ncbi:MAG: Endoglucanase G precursor [Firmicutes bacterium ADurb.Bin419]|nr:MAG: Endoglucanase G precursor [Firmicutes bacterium ADurb.Bin419]
MYSDYEGCSSAKKATYTNFAKQQVDYALGSTGMSYMIGYGDKYPQHPHHRTAQSSWCDSMNVPKYHRHTLVGALVGGPGSSDDYSDMVSDYVSNEVACDYNAGFVGALAKFYDEYGGNPIPNYAAIEEPTNTEIYVQAKITGAGKTEVNAKVFNQSGWPARNINTLSFRYFLDLSEYVSAGYDPAQVTTGFNYTAATSKKISKPIVYDEAKKIYYVEVDLTGTNIFPGSNSDHQKEIQMYIQPPAGAPWDNTNDWSYIGAMEDSDIVPNIPVYEAGTFIFGVEPDGSTPKPSSTKPATPTPVVTPTKTNTPYPTTSLIIGDADLSGSFNSIDMGVLKQHLLGMPTILTTNSRAAMAADVDGSGTLNSIDLGYMKQRLLGMIKNFPVPDIIS